MQKLFNHFNKLVFDDMLPKVPLSRADLRQHAAWGAFWPNSRCIQIEETLTEDQVPAVLLHEMVHLEQSIRGQAVHHNAFFRRRTQECLSLTGLSI